MPPLRAAAFVCVALCANAVLHAENDEDKVKRSDLPAAVARTVDRESAGATIRGLSKETENGKTYYEAELLVNGASKDVLIDSEGAVVEVEQEVALDALPAVVRQALTARAGRGKIVRVESLTRDGKVAAYEARVRTGVKGSEIEVDLEGRPLDSAK